MNFDEHAKYAGDALSAAVVVGTLAQVLPAIAALMTIIWTAIRIYETKSVQRLLGRAPIESRQDDSE
jgi:peptidoglycan biosynthesis protein MviN/MurJ (putative lipid II flippase)